MMAARRGLSIGQKSWECRYGSGRGADDALRIGPMEAAWAHGDPVGMDRICGNAGRGQPRKGRRSEGDRVYLLTTVSFGRLPLFADWRCAWAAADQVNSSSNWPGAELLCWVLMPDHWHGLIRLRREGNLATAMRQAKGSMARAANLARGRGGIVWEPGFHDRALRREEDILPAARYVVGNPLRAGLALKVGQYPYWNASWL
ncbi:MAG TPA: transposase [Stenotrophomonas sp.]|nr:transposase [Stenotrophomonas sp.]